MASSSLAQLLTDLFPPLVADPPPAPECWISRFARTDPLDPQAVSLSAAIHVVRAHGQLDPLKSRLRSEHPIAKRHNDEYDRQAINCLTEACAFAWADLRQLGPPTFDYRPGAPDVYIDDATWVEAKSIGPSEEDRRLTRYLMRTGAMVTGSVPAVGPGLPNKFQYAYDDAKKKFARQPPGRYFVFFNLTMLDMNLWPRKREILETLAGWAQALTNQDPSIGIVLTYAYGWQQPLVDPLGI